MKEGKLTDYIASVDCGNGNTAAVLAGSKKTISIPSIRVVVKPQSMGLGKNAEVEYTTAEWRGEHYAVGDDVLFANRARIDRHMGQNRYGGEHHQFLTAYALARLGIKQGRVDLTLLCPPSMYNDLKKPMIEAYTSNPVEIKLKGDKEPRTWVYENVTVWPEGYGAAACFILDTNGELSPLHEKLTGDVLVLDVGAYTANVIRLHNSKLNSADLPKSSLMNGGGNTHIRQPLLEWVQSGGGDLRAVTLDDIDRVLRLASISEDYTLRFAGKEVNLKATLDYLSKQYADWLANQLDTNFNSLQEVNSLLIVGGNAAYVADHLHRWYKKAIQYSDLREFARLHASDLNAVGGLRLALARLNAKK